ncbi:MAG: hypothetical protein AB7E28_06155 [Desulfurella sp.]|jgi:hypothetical protein
MWKRLKNMPENNKSNRNIQKMIAILKHVFNVAKNLGYFAGDNLLSNIKMPH